MLTSEQSIVEYKSGLAIPDRLTQQKHGQYLAYAEKMLAVYRNGIGQQRRNLHRQIEGLFAEEPDCSARRIQAFCKLLDDASDYQTDPEGESSKLRLNIFSAAAKYHPLVTNPDKLFEHCEMEIKEKVAEQVGLSLTDINRKLYADVISFQILENFEGYSNAESLLARYNVAQLQACLYRAEEMVVDATEDFKTILRYAKLSHLLHDIIRIGPSRYRIRLTGPAAVLRHTRRYGVRFARFLPAILSCKGWQLNATITTPWNRPVKLFLSDRDGFTSHIPAPDEFDSKVEEAFALKFGQERDGWTLVREGEILHQNQTAFLPDFVFRHEDGTEALLEIVGFWTEQYLADKRKKLRLFSQTNILLAVAAANIKKETPLSDNIIVYKTALKIKPILDALEKFRNTASSTN